MNKGTIKGFLYGILSSSTFGLIPLFTLPLIAEGLAFPSILMYRFVIACAVLFSILLIQGISLRLSPKEIKGIILLSIFYDISSLFLFWGFHLISSGVAVALHFIYPVITTILMMVLFKEKKSFWRFLAIGLAILGVALLSVQSGESKLSFWGIIIVLISGVGYASYLVAINQLNLKMNSLKLTFYVFMCGGIFLFLGISLFSEIQPIPSLKSFAFLSLLAVIPTIFANLALIKAIKAIGSTITSVLGAMEPVTALFVGVIVFGESLSLQIGIGISLILAGVMLVILKR